jgi:hypothetical protein
MNLRLVFTAYNRPHYFAQTLDAWTAVRGFPDWKPLVLLEPSPVGQQMATLAQNAGCTVHLNPHKLGVLTNPWTALNTAFTDGADFTVLAEDDLLPSTDILEMFAWAADELRITNTLTVCAASLAPTARPGQQHHLTSSGTFCSQIWGTWASRWDNVLRDTWDHTYSTATDNLAEAGWDWNIYRRIVPDGWRIAHPVASRATHIGELGGVHTTPASFPASQLPTFTQHRPPGRYQMVDLCQGDAPTP